MPKLAPQSLQNLEFFGLTLPHSLQPSSNFAPHLLQNLESDSFSLLHFGHVLLSNKLFALKSSNCFLKSEIIL